MFARLFSTRRSAKGRKPQYPLGLSPCGRRLLCEALEARTLLSVGLAQAAVAQAAGAASQQTLADLPVAAQQAVSSAIGQDQPAYHATSAAAGVTLANPANGFTAQLQSGDLQISAGSDTWNMSLVGLSYGGATQPVGTAKTTANGNRVDCNYGMIDEWYVNGPSGLEQGFNVTPPSQHNASGPLTVQLALGGDLKGTVSAAGDGLTLTGPDGSAALGYTGLTACDATGKTLPASLEVQYNNGHQDLLIHVNAFGARGPITIDPFVQKAKLTASDGAAGDFFGEAVSISGNTLVVGADNATVGGNGYQGAAYVFTGSGTGWANMTQTAKLTASDGAANDEFGWSVAISGNTVVVGADYATVGSNLKQGAAYVFTGSGSSWPQTAKLTASDGAAGDAFGRVSINESGNTVVVGSPGATIGGNTQQGAAYVFTGSGFVWTQTAELTASDGAAKAIFGWSTSISGNTVVVGARSATVGVHTQGAAYVFTEPNAGWADMTETAKLTASDGATGDCFGQSVSISGNTLVVGAFLATVNGNAHQGAAYVFVELSGGWAGNLYQTAKLTASDGAASDSGVGLYFGDSVSVSGNTVVVGAEFAKVNGNGNQGAAYVFTEPGTGWANMTQTAKLTASDGAFCDCFGSGVSISGNTVVVGADEKTVGGNQYQGAAYVFAIPAPTVTRLSPTSGPTTGGTSVTITGTNFAGATLVDFGTVAARSFTVNAAGTQIVATSPAESAGTVHVTVTTAGGTSASSSADQFTYKASGKGAVVSAGLLARSTSVTITAAGLSGTAPNPASTASAVATDSSDQQRKKDMAILALDVVFAEYGR